jgi:hypothetical protein
MRIVAPQDSKVMWVNMPGQMESGFVTKHYLTGLVLTERCIAIIP